MIVQMSVVLRRTVCGNIDWHFYNMLGGLLLTVVMTSARVVEMSVNVSTNSPSQDYTHQGDHTLPTFDYTFI